MKYFPYDYFSARLYERMYRDIIDEPGGGPFCWGIIELGMFPDWILVRYREVYSLWKGIEANRVSQQLARTLEAS